MFSKINLQKYERRIHYNTYILNLKTGDSKMINDIPIEKIQDPNLVAKSINGNDKILILKDSKNVNDIIESRFHPESF